MSSAAAREGAPTSSGAAAAGSSSSPSLAAEQRRDRKRLRASRLPVPVSGGSARKSKPARRPSREQETLDETELLVVITPREPSNQRAPPRSPARTEERDASRMVSAAAHDSAEEARDFAAPQQQDHQLNFHSLAEEAPSDSNDPSKPLIVSEASDRASEAPAPHEKRKWSQSSGQSQTSTSLGCSLASSALTGSRRSSSVCALGLDQQQTTCQPNKTSNARKVLVDKLKRKSSSIVDLFKMDHRARKSSLVSLDMGALVGEAPELDTAGRTISQSMLALDRPRVKARDKFEVSWRNLEFAYEAPNGLLRAAKGLASKLNLMDKGAESSLVLKRVSGGFRSNQLVAIIGPSGCGKTTLLQFLAGNNRAHCDRLRIRGLAEPKVAYIGQDDALLPGLTARETLMYASRLQNSRPGFDHAQHICPILSELGLTECAERNVSKLSGGQAKRVTIAQELLYPTNLLILDEVTSGLDASTSYAIVKLLKYLVSDERYPMSIVMSIHQPSARLFSVFDQVYVMSEGCCLYEGSCELAQINQYLAKFGLVCPQYHNIADYLIELACCSSADDEPERRVQRAAAGFVSLASPKAAGLKRAGSPTPTIGGQHQHTARDQMIEHQRKLQESRQACRTISDNQRLVEDDEGDTSADGQSLYLAIERARALRPRPFWNHFRSHLSRSLLRIRRSYILTYLQLLTYIMLGLQLATFYGADIGRLSGCPRLPANLMSYVLASGEPGQQRDEDDLALEVRRIQENMNFLLVAVMTATFAALEITVITFPMEAKTVKREWRNGWYRVSSYFFGRTLADLPFQLAFVVVFCALIYVLTGQIGLDTWRFCAFVATVVMTALVAQSIGFIFGAIFMDNLPAAVFTAPLAIFPALLFSGFFSRVSQIPAFYRPMTYLSHFRYAFDALLVALYGFDRCNCDQATLDQYHASMRNQTSSMRDMFAYLFGASDCAPSAGFQPTTGAPPAQLASELAEPEAISHSDLRAIQTSNSTLAAQMLDSIQENANRSAAASAAPISTSFMKPIEDALIEGVFEQMARANSTGGANDSLYDDDDSGETSVMDRLAGRFSTRLTGLLNKQANFGHPMPTDCRQFNSYLLTEFELRDEDLAVGLLMLFGAVILTRLLCNCLLNYTIATRNN